MTRALVIISLSLMLQVPVLSAQLNPGTETGLPPNSVFHGSNLDQVNLQNGNLHAEIPIASVKQRGGETLTFSYIYDSVEWTLTGFKQSNGTVNYAVSQSVGVSSEWHLINPLVWNGDFQESAVLTCASTHQPYQAITNVVVIDPRGTRHPVPIRAEVGNTCMGQVLSAPALDGSGIQYNWTTKTVTLKNGTTIAATLVQDSNGNQNTGTNTDTLQRILVTTTNGTTVQYTTPLGKHVNGPQFTNYTVKDPNGGSQVYRVDYAAVDTTSDMCHLVTSPCTEVVPFARLVAKMLTLPNSTTYAFTYNNNSPGELARIDLPTGGSLAYTYADAYILQPIVIGTPASYIGRRGVATRTEITAGVSSAWTYGTFSSLGGGSGQVTNPDGTKEAHTFAKISTANGTSSSLYETQVTYSDASGHTLRTIARDYTGEKDPTTSNSLVNVRQIRETTTLDNNQVKKTETDYETFQYSCVSTGCPATATRLNPTEVREFDYGNGAPGALLRRTDYTYLHTGNSTYTNLNIVNRIASKTIYDSTANQCQGQARFCSQIIYEYDVYSHPNQAMVASGAVQHSSAFSTSYVTRGNQTAVKRWRNTDGAFLTTTNQYDDAGNLISSIDPLGNKISYDFTDSWANATCAPAGQGKAYITKVTNALNQITSHSYNSCTANIASTTDPNGNTTNTQYDIMGRTTTVTDPLQSVGGTQMHGVTTYTYTDTPNSVSIEKKDMIDASRSTDEFFYLDGLGRETSHSKANGESVPWDKADICYDLLGRKSFVSYPYQASTPNAAQVCSGAGDGFTYDALSRLTQVSHSDATTVVTSYTGRATDVVDEGNGNSVHSERVSQVDGIGRLVLVCEVTSSNQLGPGGTPVACGQDIAKTGFLTSYGYDALEDLISVSQGPVARSFTYNSLSELLTSTNPESGATSYTYDSDGNVLTRVRPAPNQTNSAITVTTTYGYDAVNRLKTKTYSDGTPTVSLFYDQTSPWGLSVQNPVGRLTQAQVANGSTVLAGEVFSYDSVGRVTNTWQCAPTSCGVRTFPSVVAYDLLGDVLTRDNGNGISYTLSYSVAPSMIQMTTSWLGSGNPSGGTLISSLHYNAFGDASSSQLENGIAEARGFDGRGRVKSYSATISSVTRYSFSGLTYAGNGSILSGTDSVNGTWSYTYDDFNRLKTSNCTSTCPDGASAQAFSYQYDRYGNRWNQTVTAGSGPQPQLTFNGPGSVPNNRIDGVSYDAAGNLLSDGNHNYTYDAENRVVKVDGGGSGSYTYDADGRRVARQAASGSWEYLFDLQGRVITELIAGSTTTNRSEVYAGGRHLATQNVGQNMTYFVHNDWLGTERARTDTSNVSVETCQSLAFGDGQACVGTDISPLHFTGKQRDTESNLDDFDARYYSSQWARFVTPDWDAKPITVPYATFGDPQTLNLYAYVENAPLNRIDADGHEANAGAQPVPNEPQANCGPGTAVTCTTNQTTDADKAAEQAKEQGALAQNQSQAKQLTADDVSKGIKAFDSDKGDKNPGRVVKALDTMGQNFTATGDVVRAGVKESGVGMPKAADKVLANVESITRTGDKVVITNKDSMRVDVLGKMEKTISFTINESAKGKSGYVGPELQNLKGVSIGIGPFATHPDHWGPE